MDESIMFSGELIAGQRAKALSCIKSVSEQLIRLEVTDFGMQSGKNQHSGRWCFLLHLPKRALEGKPKDPLLAELARWMYSAKEEFARTIEEAIPLLERASFSNAGAIGFHTMFSVKDGVGYMLSVDGLVNRKVSAQYSKEFLKGTQLEAIGNLLSEAMSQTGYIMDSLKQIERRIKLHELLDAKETSAT